MIKGLTGTLPDLAGKTLLVVRLSALGDVIRTLPAVLGLQARYPSCRVVWLVESGSAGYLRAVEGIELIEINRTALRKGPLNRRWRAWREVLHEIRALKPDLSLDFHGVLKSGLFPFVARIPVRVGFERGGSKEGHRWLINRRVTLAEPRVSRYERNLTLVRAFDPAIQPCKPSAILSAEDRDKVCEGMPTGAILLFPGTSAHGRNKRWPIKSWAWLYQKLQQTHKVLFSFGPDDEPYRRGLSELLGETMNCLPPLGLASLAAALERARVLVACDTGPMHLAAVLGVPIVALMGPSDPILNQPMAGHNLMVLPEVPCAPCRFRGCPLLICQDTTTPKRVYERVQQLLQKPHVPVIEVPSKVWTREEHS